MFSDITVLVTAPHVVVCTEGGVLHVTPVPCLSQHRARRVYGTCDTASKQSHQRGKRRWFSQPPSSCRSSLTLERKKKGLRLCRVPFCVTVLTPSPHALHTDKTCLWATPSDRAKEQMGWFYEHFLFCSAVLAHLHTPCILTLGRRFRFHVKQKRKLKNGALSSKSAKECVIKCQQK